ncbi:MULTISPECIES: YcgL domain-containing protein [Thiomicrorhabdus]|uniref:YcgL domain-containing protein H8792_007495 n=1 Tax=Thiomicrorhabdus heinhorstiae TaxID=2748010 RepID=A0ABS0BWJ4_9GAMM|nr:MULTISPECIES: YcgL domain-containing protein [Thiomicrorhabdus]MBF6058182.1 YcgL domain-containing protein [Thiomicrorhabdus heinhorstiae]
MQAITVSAYRSPKKDELYLFVPQEDGLEKLPKELLVMFGEPQHVIDFELTPNRKMAREDAAKVYESVNSKGYYMQMPPSEVEKISDYAPAPERLDNIC